jgi:hypothetical protein
LPVQPYQISVCRESPNLQLQQNNNNNKSKQPISAKTPGKLKFNIGSTSSIAHDIAERNLQLPTVAK